MTFYAPSPTAAACASAGWQAQALLPHGCSWSTASKRGVTTWRAIQIAATAWCVRVKQSGRWHYCEVLADLEPPPVLLATHTQLGYAAAVCWQAAAFSIELAKDSSGAVFAVAPLTTMRYECARAVKDARVEAARYAATVGGFPVEESN